MIKPKKSNNHTRQALRKQVSSPRGDKQMGRKVRTEIHRAGRRRRGSAPSASSGWDSPTVYGRFPSSSCLSSSSPQCSPRTRCGDPLMPWSSAAAAAAASPHTLPTLCCRLCMYHHQRRPLPANQASSQPSRLSTHPPNPSTPALRPTSATAPNPPLQPPWLRSRRRHSAWRVSEQPRLP